MKLVIDLRRAFESGLGTYIRHVVPASVSLLTNGLLVNSGAGRRDVQAIGLIAPGDEDRHHQYWGDVPVRFETLRAAPLSLKEQWALRRACPDDAVFWATTLSHALWAPQRLVATVHDVAQLALPASAGVGPGLRWASRRFFSNLQQRAELLLFNSHFTASEFKRYVGEAGASSLVTPLGVDRGYWQAPGVVPGVPQPDPVAGSASGAGLAGAPYFLWLGNLRPHKNLPLLLKAFEQVLALVPQHLLVVGRAPAGRPPALSPTALPKTLTGRVHFLGEVDSQRLPGLMQQASALVMPSLYEGFGLPVLEALAASCLVLAADIGALREVGADAASYFDPHDASALSQLLLTVANMPQAQRARHVQLGLARARALPWQQTAALTAGAIQTVLHAGPGARRPLTLNATIR
jgi:glycosyltransferase involved in cell wall biosynthesis